MNAKVGRVAEIEGKTDEFGETCGDYMKNVTRQLEINVKLHIMMIEHNIRPSNGIRDIMST